MSKPEKAVEFRNGEVHISLRRDEPHGCFVITTTHYKGGRRDHVDISCCDATEPDDAWAEFRDGIEAYTGEW